MLNPTLKILLHFKFLHNSTNILIPFSRNSQYLRFIIREKISQNLHKRLSSYHKTLNKRFRLISANRNSISKCTIISNNSLSFSKRKYSLKLIFNQNSTSHISFHHKKDLISFLSLQQNKITLK